MDYLQKIQFAANSYYNRGLEMAKERDLSGAALYLKEGAAVQQISYGRQESPGTDLL